MIPPRLKPLSARKSAILSVLDVGTSKIACLIARLMPVEPSETLRGRTHRCRILGIGHQRSRGMKGGQVVDMEETEAAIRVAVDAAERMAGVQVESVIVNASGGRLSGQHYKAEIDVIGGAVRDADIHRVLEASCARTSRQGRAVLHSLPTAYSLDAANHIRDPRGMIGERLGADLHVASCDTAAARNLMLAIERCHLGIEAMVATPYAAGLSALVDDEADMGTIVVDMGGGTTSIALFSGGVLAHLDAFAVGGNHVTMDIARGLNARLADAERLKTLYGSAISSPSDDRETITRRTGGGRQRPPRPSAEIASHAHHPAARRRDSGAGARPARPRRFPGSRGSAHRSDRRREPAHRPARSLRGAFSQVRCASAARSASRACRIRQRAPASPPPWD